MPVGWDHQIDAMAELGRALRSRAREDGIVLAEAVVDILVTRAVANILQQSENDEQFRFLVGRAIDVLPQASAELAPQISLESTNAFRAFVRTKACPCPWPWGAG